MAHYFEDPTEQSSIEAVGNANSGDILISPPTKWTVCTL